MLQPNPARWSARILHLPSVLPFGRPRSGNTLGKMDHFKWPVNEAGRGGEWGWGGGVLGRESGKTLGKMKNCKRSYSHWGAYPHPLILESGVPGDEQ